MITPDGSPKGDHPIYLDYNATTPLLPEVVAAMLPHLHEGFGNPSSSHALGRAARVAMEAAREQVAALLGCDPDEIVFTSGGTESNNLAIRGVTENAGARRAVVTSLIEHPAVAAPCAWLERHEWKVTRAGVDADGRVRLDELRAAIDAETALVTVMHANNETGVLQPLAAVAEAARAAGAVVHTDAAQSVGKVPVRVRELGVDLLSVVGHKLYGPKGVGALYVRRGVTLAPLLRGAGHERGLRPGTENVASIAGLGVACERARLDMEAEAVRVRILRDRLWERLRDLVPGLALNGHAEERLPNTLSVRFPGVSGNAVLAATPEVAASTGSACHAGGEEAPAVVVLMGVSPQEALGTVRLTLGRRTTLDEVERAAAALAGTLRLRRDGEVRPRWESDNSSR
jgi:cysteine desulfurase